MTLALRAVAAVVLLAAVLHPTRPPTPTPTRGATVDRVSGSVGCDVRVRPGQDLRAAVGRAPRGATICVRRGTYPLTTPVVPRAGQTLVGDRAVLRGSRVLTGWRRAGAHWVVGGQRQQGQRHGVCTTGTSCQYPDDVLRDGRALRRVLSRAALRRGSYYFDYRRDRILLADAPRGHRIEALVARAAVVSRAGGRDVTVRGFVVEEFATLAQHGAIATSEPGWVVEDNVVRANHGAGITSGGDTTIRRNRVVANGQLGIGGAGPRITVTGNLILGNGGGGFDPAWEAGGGKWAVTEDLVVRGNTSVANRGPGLWTDIDAQDTTYADNTVRANDGPGIFHEISADAVITGNSVSGNGRDQTWLWGAGILLAGSHHVEVRGNRLRANGAGIGLVQQDRGTSDVDGRPRTLHDLVIADNDVDMGGLPSGGVTDSGYDAMFDDPTITWTGNTWRAARGTPFWWDDRELTLAQWRALGHDG